MSDITVYNLTPHEVCVLVGDTFVRFQPSGQVARVSQLREVVGEISGIPVSKATFGEVVNLPEPVDGAMYIVSLLTQQACPDRTDLLVPDTGAGAIRDENGHLIAVKGFLGCTAIESTGEETVSDPVPVADKGSDGCTVVHGFIDPGNISCKG